MDQLSWFEELSRLDYFVIIANLLLLVFAGPISRRLSGVSERSEKRSWIGVLRFLSAGLLALYLLPLVGDLIGIKTGGECTGFEGPCDKLFFQRLSKSGLTLLGGFIVFIVAHAWVVRRYGRTKEVDGQTIKYQTYQSELLSILTLGIIILICFLTILGIWGVEEWLKTTSVLGGIAVILFFTKDVWLPDIINGLILLYKHDIEPGSVVRIKELDLCGVTLRTTLLETTFRDLVTRHKVVIPNSLVRQHRIEILSSAGSSGLTQSVDFKIGYDADSEAIETLLKDVWAAACEAENAINEDVEPKILIADNGDHAIVWRLFYTVKNVYRINPARYAVNRAAHLLSTERDIGLNTPMTHQALI